MATWSIAALRTILATETDADSPGSEELMSQIRENIEAVLLLCFGTNVTGTITAIAETVLTDTANFTDSAHIDHTVIITSGPAIGNSYHIHSNTVNALTCTGDTMVSDGVAIGNTFAILYDLKNNLDGHDHDGKNSPAVGGAIKAGGLDTATSELEWAHPGSGHGTVTGGSYCFWPQIKETGDSSFSVSVANAYAGGATYSTEAYGSYTGGISGSGFAQFRYMQSSGEVFWIFLLKEITTGKILMRSAANDHVCWGNGGDPEIVSHPFGDYDEALHEIIIITPTKAEVKKIRKEAKKTGKSFLEIFIEDYEVDDESTPVWPTIPVTVDLDEDIETGKKTVIKKTVPKKEYFIHKKLKKKK